MEIPDYDIVLQPMEIEIPDGWNNAFTKYVFNNNYTIEQLVEEEYQEHKKEHAIELMRSILRK